MKITTHFLLLTLLWSSSALSQTPNYFKEKKVIAICNPSLNMSKDIGFLKGLKYEFLLGAQENEMYGKYRTYQPLTPFLTNPLSTEQALELEIKMAKAAGIDGFEFPLYINTNTYYLDRLTKTIIQYVNLADEKKLDFSFALKVNFRRNPNETSEEELLFKVGKILSMIYSKTSFSEKWMRNQKNEIIVFTSTPESILDESLSLKMKELEAKEGIVERMYHQFQKVNNKVSYPLSFVYETKFPNRIDFHKELFKYFDAISLKKNELLNFKGIAFIKEMCKDKNKGLVFTALSDNFNTQMITKANDVRVKGRSELSKTLKLSDIYLLNHNLKLTEGYRSILGKAVNLDADLIRIDSWNQVNNGTHIFPEIHHGYGYALLLKYYKNLWLNKGGFLEKEMIITAYKAYPSKFNEKTEVIVKYDNSFFPEGSEDSIEVVSFLNEKGEVYCNGQFLGKANKGITVFHLPMTKGVVSVDLKRYDKSVISYTTKKEISFTPKNTDGLTYIYTNLDEECDKELAQMVFSYKKKEILKRFLVSDQNIEKWAKVDYQKYKKMCANFEQNAYQSNKFYSEAQVIDNKYQKAIKSFLDEVEYNVWRNLYIKDQNTNGDVHLFVSPKENKEEGFILEEI
ncbi:hypothetical protein [Flammeovirga pacifica]|uniref:PEGA domain-containing protein n=1 Tax=Flammeovirga pacifica TaxID=915059 RepID=A0A1S1YYU2_FLAPC|nr:hypothetical protein [Flammeovirga pacifica]OHX66179.1 hypothetical protein NH26_07355 [Flammeovirga pacifica]